MSLFDGHVRRGGSYEASGKASGRKSKQNAGGNWPSVNLIFRSLPIRVSNYASFCLAELTDGYKNPHSYFCLGQDKFKAKARQSQERSLSRLVPADRDWPDEIPARPPRLPNLPTGYNESSCANSTQPATPPRPFTPP